MAENVGARFEAVSRGVVARSADRSAVTVCKVRKWDAGWKWEDLWETDLTLDCLIFLSGFDAIKQVFVIASAGFQSTPDWSV